MALAVILSSIDEIAALYPKHIEKKDKHFFFPIIAYFTVEEQAAMLAEFYEFDRKMIHEKYTKVIGSLKRTG
jgi:hypothetical protein